MLLRQQRQLEGWQHNTRCNHTHQSTAVELHEAVGSVVHKLDEAAGSAARTRHVRAFGQLQLLHQHQQLASRLAVLWQEPALVAWLLWPLPQTSHPRY